MRYLLIVFLTVFLGLSGCAQKDAFSRFEFVKDEELSFDNVMFSKLTANNHKVYAAVAALHLNEVYPKRYNHEKFYIILFAKNRKYLTNLKFTLNDKAALKLEKLPAQNEFSHLLRIENEWSNYYLVEFPSQEDKKLTLKISLANKAEAKLVFNREDD
ncbi:hypothetical protein MNB_SM-7-1449 [hydrothermal vent metagenome]|uniref:Lipoprotein n=1 Tax=hydrothermal vent metagenome TaxID=652676 RepID=A0A1W1B8I1_9ZZZZ